MKVLVFVIGFCVDKVIGKMIFCVYVFIMFVLILGYMLFVLEEEVIDLFWDF